MKELIEFSIKANFYQSSFKAFITETIFIVIKIYFTVTFLTSVTQC